jgi:putative sigma-54 modulation protein
MNLKISGHHLELTPALQTYVNTRLEKIKRHSEQIIDVVVLLSVDVAKGKEKRQKAEIKLRLKGKALFVESENNDLYTAIDLMIDKLDRQIMRYKGKRQAQARAAI